VNIDSLRARKDKVITTLTGGLGQLARRRNVTIVRGNARFTSPNTLEIAAVTPGDASQTLTFDHCILASGSRPARIPAFDIGSSRVMDSTGALELADIPESLLVVGGGYIGLEMGTVYAELGTRVSVVELTDTLLPGADRDLVKPLQQRLEKLFEKSRSRRRMMGGVVGSPWSGHLRSVPMRLQPASPSVKQHQALHSWAWSSTLNARTSAW
jgi:dihydrolipoamide dehydrogenase